MRIGILTQPLRANYGGSLQNWALQQVLIRLGHTPVTISYGDYTRRERLSIDLRWFAHQVLRTRGRHVVEHTRQWRRGCRHMQDFCRRHIAMSSGERCCSERHWASDAVDAYVVGSDQVWRPRYNLTPGQLTAMFGGYAAAGMRLVAYAASFGTDEWEMNAEQTEQSRRLISRFSGVSVRESGAVELCRRHLNTEATLVLDPTLLLSADDYRSLITPEASATVPSGSLGVYFLDPTPAKMDEAERMASRLGLRIHTLGAKTSDGEKASVESWLAAFDRCEYIVTDSFHGTVFSILFHRPFASIVNERRGAGRITSLLTLTGLVDRTTASTAPIDWAAVDDRLATARPDSLSFLRTHLPA